MHGTQLFQGVGVALVTLFDDDGAVDAPATAALAAKLVELGVRAVVVAGTTGEAATLDLHERTELLSAVRKAVPERLGVPVIAGTGAATTEKAVSYTEAARDCGADGALTLTLPGVTDQRPYYEAVVEAAGPMPVLGYHFPKVSGPGIEVDDLDGLPIAGLKDSSGDPGRLLLTLSNWYRPLYSGSAALITMGGALGCAGMILGLANVEPETCASAFEGDSSAQLRLAAAIQSSDRRFPGALKEMVAERFGTSPVARVR